jgi:prophage DNA circulation protein
MTTRLKDLLPALIEGIPVFVKNEIQSEGGRKIILHEYPNSNTRFVEDQGQLPPRFSMSVFVSGEDYINRAEQLERVLNQEGKISVSMPNFGVKSLFAMPFRKDATQREVGEIRFECEFVEGTIISGPIIAAPTSQTVFGMGDIARLSVKDVLGDLWSVPSVTSNVLSAEFDLKQLTKSINIMKASVNNVGDISVLQSLIEQNTPTLVRDALELSDAFVGLWQEVSIGLTGGQSIPELVELTRYGSGLTLSLSDIRNANTDEQAPEDDFTIPLWPTTTANRIKRNLNRLSLVNTGRICALITAYEQAADTTYKTDTEIEETRQALEDANQRLMRVDTDNKTLVQSQPEVRRAVEDLRLASLAVLDQKEQSAYILTTIENQVSIGSFTEAYMLYMEDLTTAEAVTSRGIEVRALNPLQPADRLTGTTTVFQI